MKLLLQDYVASLRERDELDQILVPLLTAMGFRVVREAVRGQAEHGLDIAAVGVLPGFRKLALILIQVKKGDITRQAWDTGPNAVRQSLTDLIDHADTFQSLTGLLPQKLPVIILLAHNGQIEPNVRSAYDGFVTNTKSKWKRRIIEWDLGSITTLLSQYLLREELFPKRNVSLLRRLLVYLEVPGYDLRHLVRLIDATVPSGERARSQSEMRRALLQIGAILLITEHFARWECQDLGVSVRAYERALLRIFLWLREQQLLNDEDAQELTTRILNSYFRVSIEMLQRLAPLVEVEDGMARTGPAESIEYPLRCLSIGSLAAQQFLLLMPFRGSESVDNALEFLGRFLLHLSTTASGITRPLFDHDLTTVALVTLALYATGKDGVAGEYLEAVVDWLTLNKMRSLPLPEGNGNLEAVGQLMLGSGRTPEYVDSSSCLLTALAELTLLLKLPDVYEKLYVHWHEGVNLQQWYPTDRFIEFASATPPDPDSVASSEVSIQLPRDPEEFLNAMVVRACRDQPIRETIASVPFFEMAALLACRTLDQRLPPFFWRRIAGERLYPTSPEK